MPLFDFFCPNPDCPNEGKHEQHLVKDRFEIVLCAVCGVHMVRMFPLTGGYTAIPNNGASVRPKGAGSRK